MKNSFFINPLIYYNDNKMEVFVKKKKYTNLYLDIKHFIVKIVT